MTDFLNDKAVAFSVRRGTSAGAFPLADGPWGVVFTGHSVWVTASNSDRVYKISDTQ